ncbi:MAG TPA: MurR/RpiR family transcriptional regulator [Anaerolineales bacterium]|nr:MurR/RpiR family transcriptional regulator [Anaerolineales bacterium]
MGDDPRESTLNSESFEDRIREIRSGFSPSFQRLADFLLDSYTQAALLTATELAHALDIDPATVVRFAQRLGYPGYLDLQREIRRKVKRELFDTHTFEIDSLTGIVDAAWNDLLRFLDLCRRTFPVAEAESLIVALDEAERVVLLAEGLALAPARVLAAWLEAAGYTIHLAGGSLSDLARAIAGARRGDLCMAIEVVDPSPFQARAMAEARESGIRTAAIVASPSSRLASHVDIVLAAQAPQEPMMGQALIEAFVYVLVQMLAFARPGRFAQIDGRTEALARRIASAPPD